jgi:hypothetical protein
MFIIIHTRDNINIIFGWRNWKYLYPLSVAKFENRNLNFSIVTILTSHQYIILTWICRSG